MSALSVSYKGVKHVVSVAPEDRTTIAQLKEQLSGNSQAGDVNSRHIKQGKILSDDSQTLASVLRGSASSGKKPLKLMALGMTASEIAAYNESEASQMKQSSSVRDDMTPAGRLQAAQRIMQGRRLNQGARKGPAKQTGFGRMELLPMLPERAKAEAILGGLMGDPGIMACMEKRGWFVPVLAEMYPEGKVGVSDVCVMGLNMDKGQKILLRLRTDDLQGFRKMESIRKVLFHELTHNEISPHDDSFFQLMRVVEKECNTLDRPAGALGGDANPDLERELAPELEMLKQGYVGGSGRLGGDSAGASHLLPARVMAGTAAVQRLTKEEEEVVMNCGCGDSSVQHLAAERETTVVTGTTTEADLMGPLAKGDLCEYDARGAEGWVPATVNKVHFDDGPDKPYYTILFERGGEPVEKQTEAARLRRL
ncbi:hypothetical protein TeGR_g6603 [Tetraparma gracilis]|uniref:WLM domain-containing protein n=1 Tax=Tetraparma gracilis TaxID=2962635 RepID=A0ABQ6MPX6_9STRA|nr:hypothetical protein TeGR_g6603 [Tetraparma gracilis]